MRLKLIDPRDGGSPHRDQLAANLDELLQRAAAFVLRLDPHRMLRQTFEEYDADKPETGENDVGQPAAAR
ncbi:MAG TPA: hypothetical protein VHL34_14920 [Rhizomicrobium sp.]|jgi:hypothetical protein|nr:hypothetical protein [Rhizomicrobium sp.]